MTISGKTKAVRDWLAGFDDYIKLNATQLEAGECSMSTVYNDAETVRYIDNTCDRRFTFAVVMVRDWSSGFDDVNEGAQAFADSWFDWVEGANAARNFPNFGERCEVLQVVSLQNVPNVAATYQEEQLARYTFQAAIDYREKEQQ